jgi:putative tryptophan/tyrosine transport system substrate-binding protein
MGMIGDALGAGVVASLARPGGTVTGMTLIATDTVVKRLQLVRELSRDLVRIAVLFNGKAPSHRLQVGAIEQAAPALGFLLQTFPIASADDVDHGLHAALEGKAQALFTHDDPVVESHRERIGAFAMRRRIPVIAENRPMLMAGALMSYNADHIGMWRRAAEYVDKILRGAEARRPSGRAADQVRSRRQSQDRQAARPRNPRVLPRPCRRGDRVRRRAFLAALAASAAWPLHAQGQPMQRVRLIAMLWEFSEAPNAAAHRGVS